MNDINQVVVSGTVESDPEVKYTGSGFPICELNIAMKLWSKTGEDQKQQMLQCTALGSMATQMAGELKANDSVMLVGKLMRFTNFQIVRFAIIVEPDADGAFQPSPKDDVRQDAPESGKDVDDDQLPF